MDVTNAAAKEKRSFFAIYKPGQGKWVRWGTVAGMGILAALGTYWVGYSDPNIAQLGRIGQLSAAVVWVLLWVWVTFWFVNSPKYGEFMIMTESEMRKVSWPSRKEVVTSVKIVIILTLLMGVMLGLVDIGFIWLFRLLGLS